MIIKMEVTALPAGWIPAAIAHKEAEAVIEEAKIAIKERAIKKTMPRIMASIDKISKNGCFYTVINFTHDFDVNIMVVQLLEELGYKVKFLRHSDIGSIYEICW